VIDVPDVPDVPDAPIPKPRPQPTPVSQPFWDALRAERVELQHCDDCGRWVYYPRSRCPACLSEHLTWTPVDGLGTVYTFTVAEQPTAPPFADEVPQLLAIVELAEGVRVSTTLVDADPAALAVGAAVVPVFDHGDDGITLLRFRPRS
jgi:uncharacterized OB-fold protein